MFRAVSNQHLTVRQTLSMIKRSDVSDTSVGSDIQFKGSSGQRTQSEVAVVIFSYTVNFSARIIPAIFRQPRPVFPAQRMHAQLRAAPDKAGMKSR